MKICVDSEILEEKGLTVQDFGILLYYIGGGTGVPDEEICKKLNKKGYLLVSVNGYVLSNVDTAKIESIMNNSFLGKPTIDSLNSVAKELRNLFPQGKKPGTPYYWRDSVGTIERRLASFFRKYGQYPYEDIIQATKNYIDSFNGNYTYMQILKYFIFKNKRECGEVEETSQLLSYIENLNSDEETNQDWTVTLKN